MKEVLLIKLGEIVLKGLNRKNFEDRLIKNIRQKISSIGNFEIKNMQSTIYLIPLDKNIDFDMLENKINKIFGISRYARAAQCEKNLNSIKETISEYLFEKLSQATSFKVESKRSDKNFYLKSPEISAIVGKYILEKFPNTFEWIIIRSSPSGIILNAVSLISLFIL